MATCTAPVLLCLACALASGGESPFPPKPELPTAAAVALAVQPAVEKPNIIYCIGDGMGINHLALARRVQGGADSRLHIDRLPVAGVVLTHSTGYVTDSAAAGTALSSGVKTRNGVIGMDTEGGNCLTILEGLRRSRGYSTGLVVTKSITDATPAAFACEAGSRKQEEQIAGQLLEEHVDVLLGGGLGQFVPVAAGGKRSDGRDLLAEAAQAGTSVLRDRAGLDGAVRLPVLGLFASGALDSSSAEQPSLAEMSRTAIRLLAAGGKPFLLMIEGSQIDSYAHGNDAAGTVREILHFDLAVREACAFAASRTDTIVIVTTDHETGGLQLLDSKVAWATGGHSASPVGVYAGGAGAALFTGMIDNTEIPRRLAGLAGLKPFPANEP